jgi:hypothetical protein
MGFGTDWSRFLAHPAFLVNLDRRPDRLALATKALTEAGFTDQRRFVAIDGQTADMPAIYARHGITRFSPHDPALLASNGKQGCFLSHIEILRHARDLDLPFAHFFEDDIAFHTDFARLGPQFLRATPAEADMIYMGAQMEPGFGTKSWSAKVAHGVARGFGLGRRPHKVFGDLGPFPVFCLHAFSLTRKGIAAVYDFLTQQEQGVYVEDCMIIDGQRRPPSPYVTRFPILHSVWDARRFPDSGPHRSAERAVRNAGLVYQDADLGSDIGTD